MSNQADIRDIQILGDLKTAFGRFGEDVLQVLAALEKQFEEIQEQLEERQRHWGRQMDQARDQLREARHEMHKCHRKAERSDDYVDCSFEEDQFSNAEKILAECEPNWETVKQWRHRIEGQIADFEGDMHRLSNLASSRTSSVLAFLANKIEILDRYVGGNTQDVPLLPMNTATTITIETNPTQLQNKTKDDKIQKDFEPAKFGHASTANYGNTFFAAHPYLKGQVVIHHAVPQNVLIRYPGLVTKAEIHSLENLRGIPKAINNDFHASLIRCEWNTFYAENRVVTKDQLLQKASEIDTKYGHNFLPPTGNINP